MILSKNDISTNIVKQVLKSNSNDVGTLCTSDTINPWSKYKPVNLKEPCPDRSKAWWKGDNGRCGFTVGIKNASGVIHNITNLNDVANGKWYYDKITKANPKRLADFRGYNSEAVPIISSRIDTGTVNISKSKGDTHLFLFDLETIPNEENLCIYDFQGLNEYYFAAAVKGDGTFGLWREYRGTPVLDDNGGVGIDVKNLNKGFYDCILFASTSKDPNLSGDIIPLPSDINNRTAFLIKIGSTFSFKIELTHIARSLTGNYTFIDDIPFLDELGKGGYKCPKNGTVYFKGNVIRTSMGGDTVNDVDLEGESSVFQSNDPNAEPEPIMVRKPLSNCVYNLDGTIRKQISTPDGNINSSYPIIIKWDGYTGKTEPYDPDPIDGGLILYAKEGHLGDAPGFDLVW